MPVVAGPLSNPPSTSKLAYAGEAAAKQRARAPRRSESRSNDIRRPFELGVEKSSVVRKPVQARTVPLSSTEVELVSIELWRVPLSFCPIRPRGQPDGYLSASSGVNSGGGPPSTIFGDIALGLMTRAGRPDTELVDQTRFASSTPKRGGTYLNARSLSQSCKTSRHFCPCRRASLPGRIQMECLDASDERAGAPAPRFALSQGPDMLKGTSVVTERREPNACEWWWP